MTVINFKPTDAATVIEQQPPRSPQSIGEHLLLGRVLAGKKHEKIDLSISFRRARESPRETVVRGVCVRTVVLALLATLHHYLQFILIKIFPRNVVGVVWHGFYNYN